MAGGGQTLERDDMWKGSAPTCLRIRPPQSPQTDMRSQKCQQTGTRTPREMGMHMSGSVCHGIVEEVDAATSRWWDEPWDPHCGMTIVIYYYIGNYVPMVPAEASLQLFRPDSRTSRPHLSRKYEIGFPSSSTTQTSLLPTAYLTQISSVIHKFSSTTT